MKQHSGFGVILFPIWILCAVFGDELYALIVFRDVDAAFGFAMGKPWWWVYQIAIALVFVLVWQAISRFRLNREADHSS